MKKVLALVLAVIMVCTMAMAVKVENPGAYTPGSAGAVTPAGYQVITPGKSIVFTVEELYTVGSDNKAYFNADGDFVPAKNTVTVTFAAGANLVASQGWVEVEKDVYKYVITTKANDTAGLDNKADIVISKIVTKAWGVNDPINTFKFTKKLSDGTVGYLVCGKGMEEAGLNVTSYDSVNYVKEIDTDNFTFYMAFDYGRLVDKTTIVAGATTPAAIAADILYTVKEGATVADKAYTWEETQGNCTLTRDLKVGETLYFNTIGAYEPTTAIQKDIWAKEASITKMIESTIVPNAVVDVVVNNAKEGSKLYMVTSAGLVDLGAKFDDNGVLKATVKVTGPIIMSDKALTAATPTNPGTTTNPGTGANDVVGVAAALAVVALVSGAAISMKK